MTHAFMQENPEFLDMQQNGVITYLTESNNTFQVEKDLQLRLVRMDRNFARLFFARNVNQAPETPQEAKMSLDGTGVEPTPQPNWVQIEIPAQYTLTDISGGREDSVTTPPVENQWIVVFSAKYVLKHAGANVLFIHPQRQQSIQTNYQRVL